MCAPKSPTSRSTWKAASRNGTPRIDERTVRSRGTRPHLRCSTQPVLAKDVCAFPGRTLPLSMNCFWRELGGEGCWQGTAIWRVSWRLRSCATGMRLKKKPHDPRCAAHRGMRLQPETHLRPGQGCRDRCRRADTQCRAGVRVIRFRGLSGKARQDSAVREAGWIPGHDYLQSSGIRTLHTSLLRARSMPFDSPGAPAVEATGEKSSRTRRQA